MIPGLNDHEFPAILEAAPAPESWPTWSPKRRPANIRLCYESAERRRARDIPVYEAPGVARGKAVPLLPVLEFFRACFGIAEHDTPRAARDKIAGRMLLLDETLADGLSAYRIQSGRIRP